MDDYNIITRLVNVIDPTDVIEWEAVDEDEDSWYLLGYEREKYGVKTDVLILPKYLYRRED